MKKSLLTFFIILLTLFLSACTTGTGTLKGNAIISGLTADQIPATAFTRRSIEIVKGGEETAYKTIYFNEDSSFSVDLPEGNYIVRLPENSTDIVKELPTSVKIVKDQVTILNITFDSGIR